MSRRPFTLIPEKLEAVVNAARREFSKYGYSHASTNRICREAGISKGALFHNFHSKQNLFFFLVTDGIKTAEKIFTEYMSAQKNTASYREIFVNSFHVLFNFIKNYSDHYTLYLRLIYDPDIPDRERRKGKDIIRLFTTSISDSLYMVGIEKGILKENVDEGLVRFLFNTVITRFVEIYFFPLRDPGLNLRKKSMEEISKLIFMLYDTLIEGIGKS